MIRDYFHLYSELNRGITATLESREMLKSCLKTLMSGLNCEAASVFLVNPDSGKINLFAISNEDGSLTNITLDRAEGIVGWVINNNETALVHDVTKDDRFTQRVDRESSFVTRALIAAPMVLQGQVTGALEVLNPMDDEEFSESDVEFCELVAGQLAIVVRNLALFGQTQDLLDEVQRLDRMKSSFITMASHELFTPLTKIKMQTQLLADGLLGPLTGDQKEGADRIIQSVDQLTQIARDLTNMNLLESGQISIELHAADLNGLLMTTIEETKALCEKRDLRFVTELASGLPEMKVDRRLICVLVRNLLMNAIRFTPDGGEITLSTRAAGPDVEIHIRDTGIGIPVSDQKTIFKPLVEGADTTYHHSGTVEFMSGGLGLGLPIARSIAQAHHGSIWVESEGEGRGSAFCVRLPVDPEGV